jgi:spore maturation protein SpmA
MGFFRRAVRTIATILQSISLLNSAALALFGTTIVAIAAGIASKSLGVLHVSGPTLALYLTSFCSVSFLFLALIFAEKYRVFRVNLYSHDSFGN